MPRLAYRVTRAVHPVFDGTGAARFGARWTSPGRPVIYAAGSYAGALLEVLAHARRLVLHEPYHALAITIPERVRITRVDADAIPGWDARDYVASRRIGDTWLAQQESAVLQVPSITGRPHEVNILINPTHPDIRRLLLGRVHTVIWDDRLAT